MCGGGGGGGQQSNDAYYYAQEQRAAREAEQQRADAAIAKADAEKVAQRNKFTTDLGTAKTEGLDLGRKYLSTRALPENDALLNDIISSITKQIPDLDPSPGRYFTDEAYQSGLDKNAQGTRDRLGNEIYKTFAPDFQKSLIPDTADDEILNNILGEQKRSALETLDFGRRRGTLNDIGYQSALNAINKQGDAGLGTLEEIGNSVLGTKRDDVRAIGDKANTLASTYQYGRDAPDITGLYGEATNLAGEKLKGLEQSIRGQTAGVNIFDPAKAMQAGGTSQGPIDIQGPANLGFGATPSSEKRRGLGGSNVF